MEKIKWMYKKRVVCHKLKMLVYVKLILDFIKSFCSTTKKQDELET